MRINFALLAIILSFSLFSCGSNAPDGKFIIKGKLTNVPDSTIVELYAIENDLYKSIGYDTIIQGEFTFRDTITVDVRELEILLVEPDYWTSARKVYVAPGKIINITGDTQTLSWNIDSNIAIQHESDKFFHAKFPELIYHDQLLHEVHTLINSGKEDGPAIHAKVDSIYSLADKSYAEAQKKELAFMATVPVTSIWLDEYLGLVRIMQSDRNSPLVPLIEALYPKLSDADKLTPAGNIITEFMSLPELVEVGDDMADGVLYDTLGNKRRLSEFAGRYILLDFWASWCGPCIESFPELNEVEKMYADNLSIISINEDYEDDWRKFVTARGLKGNQWNELRSARTGLAASYGVTGIPHYVLIDPTGKIIVTWAGYWKGIIKRRLGAEIK